MPLVYDCLNKMGNVPWLINTKVLKIVQQIWAEGGGVPSIASILDHPLPTKPDPSVHDKKSAVYKQWQRDTKRTKQLNADLYSLRCDFKHKLNVAETFVDRPFYYPYNIDFRGRTYLLHLCCQQAHLPYWVAALTRRVVLIALGIPCRRISTTLATTCAAGL